MGDVVWTQDFQASMNHFHRTKRLVSTVCSSFSEAFLGTEVRPCQNIAFCGLLRRYILKPRSCHPISESLWRLCSLTHCSTQSCSALHLGHSRPAEAANWDPQTTLSPQYSLSEKLLANIKALLGRELTQRRSEKDVFSLEKAQGVSSMCISI